MPTPIYDLPGHRRREAIAAQIEAADSDTLDITFRKSPFNEPETREFVLQGVSKPLDNETPPLLILTDPNDDYAYLTIPFSGVGSIAAHEDEIGPRP